MTIWAIAKTGHIKPFASKAALAVGALLFAATSFTPRVAAADIAIGGACLGGAQGAQAADGNNAICLSGTWQYPAYTFQSAAAAAGSSCAGTTAGTARYNSTLISMEYCDGTSWNAIVKRQAGVSAPAGSGYFVMSHDTWNGNLGGLAGANAKCLSDLTTYTSWMGYADANSRGLLVAAKVKAFLCVVGSCNTLTASTTYYFANAFDSSAGGASFTTDASSLGPNDNARWNAANYFGSSYYYWSARATTGSTQWANTATASTCGSFANGTAVNGFSGGASHTDNVRWERP